MGSTGTETGAFTGKGGGLGVGTNPKVVFVAFDVDVDDGAAKDNGDGRLILGKVGADVDGADGVDGAAKDNGADATKDNGDGRLILGKVGADVDGAAKDNGDGRLLISVGVVDVRNRHFEAIH